MQNRLRKSLLLGLSTSMLIATPALAGPPDGKGKSTADATVSTGEELRAAIDEGNESDGPFVIALRSGTYTLERPGGLEDLNETGDLDVLGDITILGNGSTIDLAGYGDRAFDVAAGASLAVEKLTVTGANLPGQSGGAFDNDGSLTLDRVTATDNVVSGMGASGGAVNNTGTVRVDRSTFSGNSATRAGGAIETLNGTVQIDRSELVENRAGDGPGNGGALHVSGSDGHVTIDRTLVSGNVAALEGGGLWAGAGSSTMIVTRSTITDNVANGMAAINGGGGLFNKGGLLTVERSVVSDNVAVQGSGSGGGILNLGTLAVDRTDISDNASARAGGGVESNDVNGAGDATLTRVALTGNTTGSNPGNGGGMHVTGSTITTLIDRSAVTGNSAANEGGGLWNFAGATMTVTRTSIVGNDAPVGPNVFQNGGGGNFTVDGQLIQPGDNDLAFP